MNGQVADVEGDGTLDGGRDGGADIVELQVEEDVDAAGAHSAHQLGAGGNEQLKADLEAADHILEFVNKGEGGVPNERKILAPQSEGKTEAVGSRHGLRVADGCGHVLVRTPARNLLAAGDERQD